MTPSSPISRPNGSKNPAQWARMLLPPTVTLASSHNSSPAGAAAVTARPSTNSVRSKTDRTMTCPHCGLR